MKSPAQQKGWRLLSGPIHHTSRIIGRARDAVAPYHSIAKKLHAGTGQALKHGGAIATALGAEGSALHSYGKQAASLSAHF